MQINKVIHKALLFLIASAVFQLAFAEKVAAETPVKSVIRVNPAGPIFERKTEVQQKSIMFTKDNRIVDAEQIDDIMRPKLLEDLVNEVTARLDESVIQMQVRKELAILEKEIDAKKEIAMAIEANQWAQACGQFTNSESIGGWGQAVMSMVNVERTPQLIFGATDFDKYCPLYPNLSERNKQHVWALVLTAMAFFESSCDPKRTGVGPNGDLMGLLQLHLDKEQGYSKGCNKGDSRTAKGNISCSLAMLNDQLRRGEPLFSTKSYWDVLRPQAKTKRALKIMAVLKHNGLCKN